MFPNHHLGEGAITTAASLTPRTSIDEDNIPGMVRSGKKKSIFLDTKPTLDKRPSYTWTGHNKVGHGELHGGPKQAFTENDLEVFISEFNFKRFLYTVFNL